jgi:glycosyltransferase involved in cell wall biosynthesis
MDVGAYYRAIGPLQQLERKGHQVVWPPEESGAVEPGRLADCDLVHVYRSSDPDTRRVLGELSRAGTAISWDNDYDPTNVPKESPNYPGIGGVEGQRFFAQQLKVARLADTVSSPSEHLSERFRRAGLARVETVRNHLFAASVRDPQPHNGIVIGWVAGPEHRADVARIPIVDALRRILADYPTVRVECVGIDLALDEQYRHDPELPFEELPARISRFDFGIAPLADIPLNHSRSDIKLKEYGAAGVPWLASPVGPYADLGVQQGGRLVPDGEWYEALRWMIVKQEHRAQLAENAANWARQKTLARAASQWEQIFSDSVQLRRAETGRTA